MLKPVAPQPSQAEARRLAAVRRYAILDTPPDGAFDRICSLAARFFEVPFASVTIVDEQRIWFKACTGLAVPELPREPGLCASAILDDEPYVITDGLADPRATGNPLVHGEMGLRFYAGAPIVTHDGHRLGTVNVIDVKPRETTEREIQMLIDLAAVVMDELEMRLAAIREVREAVGQQHRAQELARTLQRSLSPPHLPRIAGLDVAVHYEPFATEEVGGDFYDLFPLAPGRSGFFLGDVCGKGAEAAGVTSLARYTIRTAAQLCSGPEAILASLNGALLMDRDGSGSIELCTAVYGEVDTTAEPATVTVGVAGHPAPVIVRADGTSEPIAANGTLLGAVADPRFGTRTMALHPGDAIVLYSDGILDCDIGGARVDEERVATMLAGAPQASAQDLVDRLVQPMQGTWLRDDVAVMALRRAAD